MGKLIIEIRISKKTGKSAENSVMDLMPILFVIIWIMASVENRVYLSVVVCFIAFLANDIYGYLSWRAMGKRQTAL